MTTTELSWTPQHRGKVFCAPACGRGCTKKEHDHAQRAAQVLAERLGADWKPEVHENLGWHWGATDASGRWKVSPALRDGEVVGFTAFLGDAGSIGGKWAESGDTPEAAIAATRAKAEAEVAYLRSLLADPAPPWGPLAVAPRGQLGRALLELFGVTATTPTDLASYVTTELLDKGTVHEALAVSILLPRRMLARLRGTS